MSLDLKEHVVFRKPFLGVLPRRLMKPNIFLLNLHIDEVVVLGQMDFQAKDSLGSAGF